MKAEIEELKGKYYGTIVAIEHDGMETEVKVWAGDHEPSQRQLDDWGVDSYETAIAEDFLCDCHYETEATYEIARRICQALND